ncbi:MAG TPA: Trm112 family protein [Tepidisphaeraceae bacterium]|nr:Trm112 family protein [Tepidisphaeraceae bacterium]
MSSTPPSSTDHSSAANKPVDPELLAMLRCPLTHSKLRAEGEFLVAEVGGLRYPVREGIPVMLVEEAQLPAGVGSLEEFKQKFAAEVGERK